MMTSISAGHNYFPYQQNCRPTEADADRTTLNSETPALRSDRDWQRDQASRVVAHTDDSSSGAGIRLLLHIALNATPDNPWVAVSGTTVATMFKNGHSSSSSRTIQQLIDRGYVRRRRPHRTNETPVLRLSMTCNPLCEGADHVPDGLCRAALNWTNLSAQELGTRIQHFPDESIAAQYRTALVSSMRIGRTPQSYEAIDAEATAWLVSHRFLTPVSNGVGTTWVIPTQGR